MAIRNAEQAAFLAAYRECASVTAAAHAAQIARSCHYRWLHEDPEYAEEFEAAKVQAVDVLEDEAIRRAKDGCERPIYQQGRLVGTELVYSDTLMVQLLRAHKPEKYKDRVAQELSGQVDVSLRMADAILEARRKRRESEQA